LERVCALTWILDAVSRLFPGYCDVSGYYYVSEFKVQKIRP